MLPCCVNNISIMLTFDCRIKTLIFSKCILSPPQIPASPYIRSTTSISPGTLFHLFHVLITDKCLTDIMTIADVSKNVLPVMFRHA